METEDPHSPEFHKVLKTFKQALKKADQDTFKATTLETLRRSIANLQAQQHAEQRLQNLNRLGRFLDAVKEYGEVLRVFCISNEIIAFIWVSYFLGEAL